MVSTSLSTYILDIKPLYTKLRDIWSDAISDNSGCVRVNIFSELARMTLDVMGSAGIIVLG